MGVHAPGFAANRIGLRYVKHAEEPSKTSAAARLAPITLPGREDISKLLLFCKYGLKNDLGKTEVVVIFQGSFPRVTPAVTAKFSSILPPRQIHSRFYSRLGEQP